MKENDAGLQECAENRLTSIPDSRNTDFIYLATILLETGLCGLI